MSQSYVDPPCASAPTPAFENNLQLLWYRRFWTGDCTGLPVFRCLRGKPNWNEAVRTLAARAPAEQRPDVAARACLLGRRIGLEWSRPKAERRINTQDLRAFNTTLEKAPNVVAALAAVESSVKAKIGP